jgi:hypothetical protein
VSRGEIERENIQGDARGLLLDLEKEDSLARVVGFRINDTDVFDDVIVDHPGVRTRGSDRHVKEAESSGEEADLEAEHLERYSCWFTCRWKRYKYIRRSSVIFLM